MEILILALLGIVQGLCEFLPVSSSGHLVLLSKLFGIDEVLFVSILLHVATLLAIIVVFKKDVFAMIKNPLSSQSLSLAIATIPTCIIALILMPVIDQSFEGGFLPFAFLISAILLTTSEFVYKRNKRYLQFHSINHKTAFFMGVAQGLAVFPGISRSGTTICSGILQGGKQSEVAKFSFLMSIPIILLSLLMEIGKMIVFKETLSVNPLGMTISFLLAFIIGTISIKTMVKLTSKVNFKWFAGYLFILFIISLIIL